ncbi:sigma-70 family RNA polymerase sigma factor [Enterococcus italicus]|uniref:sigma-70 family RNA polymerase sigma factor n=1 Tax=Enterococcus italicus TaxID=246144 RepID=UPI003FA305A4
MGPNTRQESEQKLKRQLEERFPGKTIIIKTITMGDLENDSLAFLENLRQELQLENSVIIKDDYKANVPSAVAEPEQTMSLDFSMFDDDEETLSDRLKSDSFQKKMETQIVAPSFEHNKDYLSDYREGNNPNALDSLIKANRGLVDKNIRRYTGYLNSSIQEEDLKQWGYMGLMKAAERYNPSMDTQFSTYATFWIRQTITRGVMDTGTTVRIPVHLGEKIRKIARKEKESNQNFGEIRVSWICQELEMDEDAYYEAIQIRNTFQYSVSIDTPIGVDGDTTIGEMLPDKEGDIEKKLAMDFLREEFEKVFDTLTDKEECILRLRFGFDTGKSKTLEEVGQVYGVTRERIRQIESKVLRKLRKPKYKKMLSDFYYTKGGNYDFNDESDSDQNK